MATRVIESVGDNDLDRSEKALVTRLDTAVQALSEKQAEFAEYLNELKAREEQVKLLKEELYTRMEESGVKKLENDHITVTAVWPTSKHTFDMKELKTINPKLYDKVDELVGKETQVKGYAKIFVKEK